MKIFKRAILAIGISTALALTSVPIFANSEVTAVTLSDEVKINVSVEEYKNLGQEGRIGDITIDETEIGDLVGSRKVQERTLVLSLVGTGYEFINKPDISYKDGFKKLSEAKVEFGDKDDDKRYLYITLPYKTNTTELGQLVIQNLRLVTQDDLKAGDLKLGVSRLSEETATKIKIANVKSYGVSLDIDKIYSVTAGDNRSVDFDLRENVADSLVSNRELEFSIDNGYLKLDENGEVEIGKILVNGTNVTSKVELRTRKKGEEATSFSFSLPELDQTSRNEIRIEDLQIAAKPTDSGSINLEVTGKDIIEETSILLANIEATTEFNYKPINAKVGVNKQTGGTLTLSETSRRSFEKGIIELRFEGDPYIAFDRTPDIEVLSGNIEVKDEGWSEDEPNVYQLKVTKKSTSASVIQISNFTLSVDRTAPDGKFDLLVCGSSISPLEPKEGVEIKGFVTTNMGIEDGTGNSSAKPEGNVSDNNNQSINTPSTTNVTTVFTLNSATYTIDGKATTMDAKPYAKDGRTMLPIRYAAQAAGISNENIKYNSGNITLIGDKTIELSIGSKTIIVDGKASMMVTEPVFTNGRVYVPVSEITKHLECEVKWDSNTQSAIFTR